MNSNHSYAHYYPLNSGPNELNWTLFIKKLPKNSNWFFAFNPPGFYVGLLIEDGKNKAQFSVWDSQCAEPGKGFVAEKIEEDGKVIRIKGNYNWEIGKSYRFVLKWEENNNNKISIVSIKDENGKETKVGEQIMPKGWELNNRIDLFVERLSNDVKPNLSVIFSDFCPTPKELTHSENPRENLLGLNISISDNRIEFSDPVLV